MTNNFFQPQEINLQTQPLPTYIDSDGSFKINTPMLSTYNFDGLIPKYNGLLSASAVKPGYLIQLTASGQYFPVVSVESDDDILDNTGIVTINYINNLGNIESESYEETDEVNAIYENWAEKIVGSQGWGITSGGNAIFTNVAVRGRIEAEEGYISGSLTIGAGGTSTFNDLTTEEDLENYLSDLNDRISASIDGVYIDINNFSSSLVFLYDAGFVSSAQLVTTGATTINGNNITTGVINANVVRVTSASSLVQNRGVQFSAVGLEGYNNTGTRTFFLNTDGSLTVTGSVTGSQITGTQITGSEIIGSSFQTALTGRRIQMDTIGGFSNLISLFDSNGTRVATISGDSYSEGAITYSGISIVAQTGNRSIFSLESRTGGDGRAVLGDFDSDTNSIVTRTNLNVAGDIVSGTNNGGGGSILCYGNITAIGPGKFIGDGSQLTGIVGSSTNGYRNAGSNGGGTAPSGGNKITFSATAPPSSGRTTGDVHLRYT